MVTFMAIYHCWYSGHFQTTNEDSLSKQVLVIRNQNNHSLLIQRSRLSRHLTKIQVSSVIISDYFDLYSFTSSAVAWNQKHSNQKGTDVNVVFTNFETINDSLLRESERKPLMNWLMNGVQMIIVDEIDILNRITG